MALPRRNTKRGPSRTGATRRRRPAESLAAAGSRAVDQESRQKAERASRQRRRVWTWRIRRYRRLAAIFSAVTGSISGAFAAAAAVACKAYIAVEGGGVEKLFFCCRVTLALDLSSFNALEGLEEKKLHTYLYICFFFFLC